MNNNIYNASLKKLAENKLKLIATTIPINLRLAIVIGATVASVLSLGTVFIFGNSNSEICLAIALIAILFFYLAAFWIAPWLIDLVQQWFYQTRWISLTEFADFSPETAEAIARVCTTKNLKQLRIGIIDARHPTAFIYGSLRTGVRLVISKGFFSHLQCDCFAVRGAQSPCSLVVRQRVREKKVG